MVVGGDSCSKGRGFESRNCILDGENIEKPIRPSGHTGSERNLI